MSPGHLTVKEETYLDHCEEDTGGAKDRLGWRNIGDLLREIQALDGDIQR